MPENKELINYQEEQLKKQTIEKEPELIRDLQKDRDEVLVPREVRSWMEKVEQDPVLITNQNQNTNDDSGLQSITGVNPKIVLPTTKKGFSNGFSKKVGDAGRWLSEFVFRLIKKNRGNVKFSKE